MNRGAPAAALFAIALALSRPALAQETQFGADVRKEVDSVKESCGSLEPKAIAGCAYALATESPFHVAVGSLPPQNGLAFGLAFNEHYTPNESWRLSWDADAVAAPTGGSWRGGVYMKMLHTPATSGVVVRPAGSTAAPPAAIGPREVPVIDLFLQSISLETINYFGEGPGSAEQARSIFGEREILVGGSVVYPLNTTSALAAWRPAVVGGVAGRFIDLRPGSDGAPSIEQLYTDASAPGLAVQHAFVEFTEGLKLSPSAGGWLRLTYLLSAHQFRTSSDAAASFNRWAVDLNHEIPLYRRVSSTGPRAFNGPDSCAASPSSSTCPPVQWSRNREGTVAFRFLWSTSTTGDGDRVPFYLQPTLGGSDLNGERMLAAYDDYRFRGPGLILLQESVEHSLWGPIGAYVMLEQGKVGARAGDLGFSHLATSTTIGLTLRAGGFPMLNLSFAWGGEGHHVIGSMASTLLGGSSRPSLY